MSYKTIQLSKAADIIVGFPFASEKFNINAQGTRLVRGKNITTGNLRWGDDTRWWDDSSIDLSKYMLKADDIVIGMDGSLVGKNYAKISENDLPLLLVQRVACIRAKEGYDQRFLWGCIASGKFERYIDSIKTGTSIPHISGGQIGNYLIPNFDLPTQKKIAAILSALDEKIAINRAINDNLQQQLFSLYENMAMTSPCLKEYTLSNLCDFQEGYVNPPQTHPEYFDGEVKWLRAVDINESFIIETSRTLTKAGFESAKKSALLFKPNTIAISKSGTIGRLGIIADYMCGNRAVINIAPHDTNMLAFIYCFLKGKQREFPDMAVGSVQKNLYVSLLEPLTVFMPDDELLTEVNAVGNSILNKIYKNCIENTELANLRDTLLPKFMSGEIGVSAVQL